MQPLHTAAYAANAESVRALLDVGADVDARDDNLDGTPLAYATVGSGERAAAAGQLDRYGPAAARCRRFQRRGVDLGKPLSEEVINLLRSYGMTPDDEPAHELDL